jgi:hypothetical protein
MNEQLQGSSNDAVEAHPLADCTPEQLAETRYLQALADLLADASNGNRMHILADSLAWTIAQVAAGCGVAATGDMLRRVGGYMYTLESRRRAGEEAEQERQEGRLPN